MKRLHLIASLAAAAVVGGLLGWFRSIPSALDAPRTGGQHSAQALPAPHTLERSSATLFSQARTLGWLGDSNGGDDSSFRVQWTLKAVLVAEDAILLESSKEALIIRAKVGATLPDGSRLIAVKGDVAVVELDGCRIDRYLYPRASDSDSSECKAVSPKKDPQQS